MKLENLQALERTSKKRVGRGTGSGMGKTSTRGHKGQNSRSGGGVRPGFEGGQMPLFRRLPKRGFTNIWGVSYKVINVRDLEEMFNDGDTVDREALVSVGLIHRSDNNIKILGNGDINKKLTVVASKFSQEAKNKIEKAGGKVEVL